MTDPFEDFWQQSSLSRLTIKNYAKQISAYDADKKQLKLSYPKKASPHKKPKSKLKQITDKRRSSRQFSEVLMSDNDLLNIVCHLGTKNGDLEHRTYPSAGATYSVETFVIKLDTSKTVMYYDAEVNGLLKVGSYKETVDELKELMSISYSGKASALLLFVGFPDRVSAKYQSRGNRFMLLEAGAMMQQISLAVAQSKNVSGCAIGGLMDDALLSIVGLRHREDTAKITTGYLIGISS